MPQPPPISFSARARRTGEAPISTLIATVIANPNMISFAAGLVDPLTLPAQECLEITRVILSDPGRARAALQYDTTVGLAALRRELLAHIGRLERRPPTELGLTAEDLLVTTGSQQMLYLVSDALLDEGDIVICGDPTYFVYAGVLQSLGARVLTVPLDDQGMDVEALGALLASLDAQGLLPRVKLIYCTSYFDNPTGLTLSVPRRRRMVELARKFSREHRILILEDAAYRELYFDESGRLPSIKSFDPANEFVILTQTFSKPFAPGIKLGYTALPKDVHAAVLHLKGSHDFGSATLCQQIALEAMSSGLYAKHAEVLRVEYCRKRDLLLDALARHMPIGTTWTTPSGGLYVWVTLPNGMDSGRGSAAGVPSGGELPACPGDKLEARPHQPATTPVRLFDECIRRGVIYVPGEYCFQCERPPQNHLRLSFGQVDANQIDDGIGRLAAAIGAVVGLRPGTTKRAIPSQVPTPSVAST
jgi:2-aminoadipate transaminase